MEGEQEMMTLDDAISYYDEVAEKCRRKANIERNDYMDLKDNASEAKQLADWLNELKLFRDRIEIQHEPCDDATRGCTYKPDCPWYDGVKCNSPNDPAHNECDYDRGIFPESYNYDPMADIYYLAEKIGIHRLYTLVVELRGEPEQCEDAVSRKDVIDLYKRGAEIIAKAKGISVEDMPHNGLDALMNLPPVTPKCGSKMTERKTDEGD